MRHFFKRGQIETNEHAKIYDITASVQVFIKESGLTEGHIVVQPMHTTTGIYLNENEAFLFEDLIRHLSDQAPQIKGKYRHDNISERDCPHDEPENGHSHIKSTMYSNPSLSLVLFKGKLQIGQYQRILFAEFDGPCPRKHKGMRQYSVSIIGE